MGLKREGTNRMCNRNIWRFNILTPVTPTQTPDWIWVAAKEL